MTISCPIVVHSNICLFAIYPNPWSAKHLHQLNYSRHALFFLHFLLSLYPTSVTISDNSSRLLALFLQVFVAPSQGCLFLYPVKPDLIKKIYTSSIGRLFGAFFCTSGLQYVMCVFHFLNSLSSLCALFLQNVTISQQLPALCSPYKNLTLCSIA